MESSKSSVKPIEDSSEFETLKTELKTSEEISLGTTLTSTDDIPIAKDDSVKKGIIKQDLKKQWATIKKRKRLEKEDEDEEYGEPYVVLAMNQGSPITCYMLPNQGQANVKKLVATSSSVDATKLLKASPTLSEITTESNQVEGCNSSQDKLSGNEITSVSAKIQVKKVALKVPSKVLSPSKLAVQRINKNDDVHLKNIDECNTDVGTINEETALPLKKNTQNHKTPLKYNNKVGGSATDSKIKHSTSFLSPVSQTTSLGKSESQSTLRHVLPKQADASQNDSKQSLLEQVKFLKEELQRCKAERHEEIKNSAYVKAVHERLKLKTRQIKTLATQKKRLINRIELCKEELEKTRKALEMVESQAILWNNTCMSDLGKLIFGMHTIKNKKTVDWKHHINKAPPEVKGFVISLYMTSPKAYQLVRDCFTGLPHPKTVSKWLHGDRVENEDSSQSKNVSINELTLEETFSRVLEDEPEEFVNEENDSCLMYTEAAAEDDAPAVYYVLDEEGNITGQISGLTDNLLYSTNGNVELTTVPHHEVVISE